MTNKIITYIALADDHTLFRKGLMEIIAEFKNVEIMFDAANGKSMLEQLRQATGLPDICILDINMPEMNGFETAKAIRENWPGIKILALSMHDSEPNIIKMLRSGACGYVLKDAEPSTLEKAIKDIMAHGFYHSDLVTGRVMKLLSQETEVNDEPTLSDREKKFLEMCCSEMTYKEMADALELSHRTIDGYRDALFNKLKIKSRTGLVMYAIRTGIVPL